MEYSYTEWIKYIINFGLSDTPADCMEAVETCLSFIFLGLRPRVDLEDDDSRWMSLAETKIAITSFDPTPIVSDNPAFVPKVPEEDRALKAKDIAAAQALLFGKMCKQFILYSHKNWLHTIEEVAFPAVFSSASEHTHKDPDGDTHPGSGVFSKDVSGPPRTSWPTNDLEDIVSDF